MATSISEEKLSQINDALRGLQPDSIEVAQLRRDLTALNARVNYMIGFVGSAGNTVEGEVADIRVMAGGETAPNAGEAVQRQIKELIAPKGHETSNTRMHYNLDNSYTVIPTMNDIIDSAALERANQAVEQMKDKMSYMESLFLSRMEVPVTWTIGALTETGAETDSSTEIRSGFIHIGDFTGIKVLDGYKYRVFIYSDVKAYVASISFTVNDKTVEELLGLTTASQKPTYIRIGVKKNTTNPENITNTSQLSTKVKIVPIVSNALELRRELDVLKQEVETLLSLPDPPGESVLAAQVDDIRVSGLQDYKYSTPGAAVRGQVQMLDDKISAANTRLDALESRIAAVEAQIASLQGNG